MRAFLIDPEARTLTAVEYDGDYHSINTLIGSERFALACFNEQGDGVYVDDDGLLKGPTDFFLIEGYPQPLAGKGLVLGSDEEGNSIEPSISEEWLRDNLDFGHPMRVGSVLMFMGDRHRRMIA